MNLVECTLSELLLGFAENKTFWTPNGELKIEKLERLAQNRYFAHVVWQNMVGSRQIIKIILNEYENSIQLLGEKR